MSLNKYKNVINDLRDIIFSKVPKAKILGGDEMWWWW